MTYIDNPVEAEGPEEIDPKYTDPIERVEVLLRDPSSTDADGNDMKVNPDSLAWGPVPYLHLNVWCGHCFSLCDECISSWEEDHYVRKFAIRNGDITYITPDFPKEP